MNAFLDQSCVDRSSACERWAALPVRERMRFVRPLRQLVAENAEQLAGTAASAANRPVDEKLVSEILPLADACRWLEKKAARILAPKRHGRIGRPFWLTGHTFEVQRQPFGTVLVIGPGNYPLFLPAIHSLHALVAGNAVQLKPAPGTRETALAFARLAFAAGLDPALLEVLSDSTDAAREAISNGVDKVIFTGCSDNGRDVLEQLAATSTPAVMELSGEDAAIVLPDADLSLVMRALQFGARLNDGRTCIAPRRVIVHAAVADELRAKLDASGIPRLLFERVRDETAAVLRANSATYALGASIFTRDIAKARVLAARLRTGFVTINDVIIPTADPRMPFGGVKASGFGTTRGEEGLLEMTFPHVVAIRSGKMRPHLDQPSPGDGRLFSAYIRAAHGRRRLAAIGDFIRAALHRIKKSKNTP